MEYIILLVGKSGTGKSAVANILEKERGWTSVQSYTTRAARYENEPGHIFVSEKEMDDIENTQHVVAHTVFDEHRYCATAEQIDANDVYVVDPSGVYTMLREYHGNKTIVVFELFATSSVLKERMISRGDSEAAALERIKHDKRAFEAFWTPEEIGHYVINTDRITAEDVAHHIERILSGEDLA